MKVSEIRFGNVVVPYDKCKRCQKDVEKMEWKGNGNTLWCRVVCSREDECEEDEQFKEQN